MNPMASRTLCGSLVTECPHTKASPESGEMSVDKMRSVVVLPAPLGPSSP